MGDKKRTGRRTKRTASGLVAKKSKSKDGGAHGANSVWVNSDSALDTSASERKIKGNLGHTECQTDAGFVTEGFILVDVNNLTQYLSSVVTCAECSGVVQCGLAVESAKGFAYDIVGKCHRCESRTIPMKTSNKCKPTEINTGKNPPFEVNTRMVSYVRSLGKGYRTFEHFYKFLNSPNALSVNAYNSLLKKKHAAAKSVATDSMVNAAEKVKDLVGKDCTVSVDGTWQQRGHASHHGIVSAISIDTGKCVDIEVLSNICKGCEVWEKCDKSADAYLNWKADHKCLADHSGSACAMEPIGAVRTFGRSEHTRKGLRYVNYLGDGDSASYSKVKRSTPYEGVEVGSQCWNVSGMCRKVGKKLTGARRLTAQRIDTLQNYFGMAVRENKGDLIAMQRSVLGSLYHVASTADDPNHGMCPDGEGSWCGYNTDPDTYRHKHGIPECIVDLIESIYEDLSSPDLLGRCLHGKTQNNNECLNKVIWDHCSKEVFVGKLTVEEGAYSAVALFNDGNHSVLKCMELLGVSPGRFTLKFAQTGDSNRLYRAARKTANTGKSRRKALRAVRKGFQDKTEEEEGDLYEAGGH